MFAENEEAETFKPEVTECEEGAAIAASAVILLALFLITIVLLDVLGCYLP